MTSAAQTSYVPRFAKIVCPPELLPKPDWERTFSAAFAEFRQVRPGGPRWELSWRRR
jgi:hypothetical protein